MSIADPPEFEPETPKPEEDPTEFWSGPDRYPDLYGGEAPPVPEPEPEPQMELPEPDEEPSLAEDPEKDEEGVTRSHRPGGPDAAGPLPRVRHRVARLPVDRPGPALPQALVGRGAAPRHRGPGEDRRAADRGARPLQGPGEGDRDGRRPAHHPLRAAPGARHQGRQGRPAQGRPRLRAGRRRHPHPRPDPRQAGRRRRGPQRAPAHRAPRRRLPGAARRLVAAHRLARQGRRGPGDRRRPGQDAAPAGRGHHRRGQVGRRQRDALLDPAARHAARGPDGARRPQAGRAQPLRLDPAPADAGHHVPAPGRHRAAEPRARDGAALLVHVARPHALADRAQQGPREARRAAAALRAVRDRRARRPDDGRARRRRGLDHPHRPEGARGRHPPRARHAVPARGRDHRHDQGQRARRGSPSPCRARPTRA